MKKIIYILGVLFLAIVIVLNILFTANLDNSEHIAININSFAYIIGIILLGTLVFFLTNVINKNSYNKTEYKEKSESKKYLILAPIALYILFNIFWVLTFKPYVVGDSIHVCNLAQAIYKGNLEEVFSSMTYAGIPLVDYMQAYNQQIPLMFIFSIFFRIIHFDIMETLRVLNVISNILTVIALYKINKQLSKTYTTNKILLLTLILTFISLPMLSTFIYGDIPSLALCLFSVYFMMRYIETKRIKYPIFSSVLMMVAYMLRMNSLIFIIATIIYLLLNLFTEIREKTNKENILKVLIILIYICVAIFPASLVKNYYLSKYNMDKNKKYPNISYFLMAMEESPRGNGWYNEEIGEKALKNPNNIENEYLERIKERINYFSENIGYTFKFYTMKIASMWTENTYSAVRNNMTENYSIEKIIGPLTFYQKVLLVITCVCCLINLIKYRKHLSLDVIFLLTIFVGGFAFHILWEAKSRYIIPYIIVLIPIASINIGKIDKVFSHTIIKIKEKLICKS